MCLQHHLSSTALGLKGNKERKREHLKDISAAPALASLASNLECHFSSPDADAVLFFFFLIENVTNRMNNLKESGQIVMKPMKTS